MSNKIQACEEKFVNKSCILPPGLSHAELLNAMEHSANIITSINANLTSEGLPMLTELIQANNFSGVVSNVFTKSLDICTPYKDNHDQRYPDLINETNNVGLEIKAAKSPSKGAESHNGHSGWHLIASYEMVEGTLVFTCLKFADLIGFENGEVDWKYQGSQRNSNNSQRTETYITTPQGRAKLLAGIAYLNTDLVPTWRRWRYPSGYKMPAWSVWNTLP
ncbi:hypothetical protein [Gelidibacter japonicus]|uniref:hypothetical protein n=1 Tax=Gelidibacter japonicus TaxID=1962232 RepID=UPI003A8F5EE8